MALPRKGLQMCEYCEKRKFLIDQSGLLLMIDKNSLHAVWEEEFGGYPTADAKINYCPMCGRKLSD